MAGATWSTLEHVDVNWEVCGDGIGRVAGDPSNKFTVAGGTGNTVVAGTLAGGREHAGAWRATWTCWRFRTSSRATASDGSGGERRRNKFTVAGGTGNTVVAGTLDVAGDVDVNSGMFAVTASDGSLAISSNKFTVAGDTGNTVVAGTLNATGATTCRARWTWRATWT